MFGPQKDEETGDWRELHNEELYSVYCSPSTIMMIERRSVKWTEHVTYVGGDQKWIQNFGQNC
jgi:hypothetical protein